MHFVEYRPVYEDGQILLFDIYIDKRWIGSRRTQEQASLAVKNYLYR